MVTRDCQGHAARAPALDQTRDVFAGPRT